MQAPKVKLVVNALKKICESYKANLGIETQKDEIHQIISIDKKPRLIKMGS